MTAPTRRTSLARRPRPRPRRRPARRRRRGAPIPADAVDLPAASAEPTVWDETVAVGGYAGAAAAPRRPCCASPTSTATPACTSSCSTPTPRPSGSTWPTRSRCSGRPTSAPAPLLLSDMGRVLMTIVGDTSARHDALCGARNRAGQRRPLRRRRRHRPATPSARELLVVAGAKHGLDRRDLPPGVNLFKRRRGRRRRGADARRRGPRPARTSSCGPRWTSSCCWPTCRTRSTRAPTYAGSTVRLHGVAAAERRADDPFRTATPERQRAFENTDEYLLARWRR